MQKRLIRLFLMLVFFFLILNLVRALTNFYLQNDIILDAKRRLEEKKAEQDKLKRDLAKIESLDYIEKQARNKLNLSREGEIILLLPSISPLILPSPSPTPNYSNWQKWIEVFK